MKKKLVRLKEVLLVFLPITLLCCMSLGAIAEGTLMTIQSMKQAKAFSEDSILTEDLDLILKAGVGTVAQLDRQCWQLVAITDASLLDSLADEVEAVRISAQQQDDLAEQILEKAGEETEELNNEPAINEAPAAIIIYADDADGTPNADFDCGAAAQNMLITAGSLGYSASVITEPLGMLNGENHDAWCMQFGVEDSARAVAVLLLGTADEVSATQYDIDALLFEKTSIIE